ncbi:MAG: hypothetical protein WBG62_22265, partial [Cyclobacteriaceae bacterium]
ALLCSAGLISCNTSKEDVIPEPNEEVIGDNVRTERGSIQGVTLINLLEDTQLAAGVNIAIEQRPSYGSIELLDKGLVAYKPAGTTDAAFHDDSFTYGVFQKGSLIDIGTVNIVFSNESDATCYPHIPDISFTVTQGKPYVFEPDAELCGLEMLGFDSHIAYNGSLSLVWNDAICYSPRPNFLGEDYFVYRYVIGSNPSQYLYGYAKANVIPLESPCDLIAVDDYHYLDTVGIYPFNVLYNDNFCGEPEVEALNQPDHGSVYVNSSNRLVYEPTVADYSTIDSIRYKLTTGAESDSALLIIWSNNNKKAIQE